MKKTILRVLGKGELHVTAGRGWGVSCPRLCHLHRVWSQWSSKTWAEGGKKDKASPCPRAEGRRLWQPGVEIPGTPVTPAPQHGWFEGAGGVWDKTSDMVAACQELCSHPAPFTALLRSGASRMCGDFRWWRHSFPCWICLSGPTVF